MDGKLQVSIDKLPVKRLEYIEENGAERFPSDVDYDEKRLSLIRRVDFAWAVDKDDKKKQKKSAKESSTPWQWQSMVENLQLAHQELSVIIDLINTVEANDAVTVASVTRPKPLPNEALSDLAVSAATKLQCFQHLGKYFRTSAKALEQQVTREARFYGALIRLQQNWKVKRQRVAASIPSNEGFTIDMLDNSVPDSATAIRPSLSTVRVEHDSAGMLAISIPPQSCCKLRFGFLGDNSCSRTREESSEKDEKPERGSDAESTGDDESVRTIHSTLRHVHSAIFDEQVFDLVNREAFMSTLGVNVTGIQENYLQLSIGPGTSAFISLVPSDQDDQSTETAGDRRLASVESFNGIKITDRKYDSLPDHLSYEIYLQQIFHNYLFIRSKIKPMNASAQVSVQAARDSSCLLGHFCMSLAHRIFANEVLKVLESVVCRVPCLSLLSHPAWHSRTSSWTLSMKVPESILYAGCQTQSPDTNHIKFNKSQFRTKVIVVNDSIKIEGEGSPNVVGLFRGTSQDNSSINRYDCDLADLAGIILQQVASQVIWWLHEEALLVGIKATRDFLCLSFELEQGETLSLVAQVNPEDSNGCISWWLVLDDGFSNEGKLHTEFSDGPTEYRKFLGPLSLDVLYSTLMDLVTLCNGGVAH